MAKSVLDIVIKLSKQGGADKETVTGLIKVKSAMMDAAAVAGTLVAVGFAIAKAWEQTAGVAVSYANEVRGVTQSTGLQVEEASKLIQVLDDMKISYDDLQKAVAKNGDKFDYSIQGLAKMSDAYKALGTEQERTEFMQERFGKNWVQFVEVMQQGSTKLLQAGNDINKALILDDKALASAREYEQNLDNVNDSVLALKVSMGNELIPVANDLVTHYTNISESLKENGYWYTLLHQFSIDEIADKKAQGEAADSATTSYTAWAYALESAATSTDEFSNAVMTAEEAVRAASSANQEFLSVLGSMQSSETSYIETAASLTRERMDLEAEKQVLLSQGYTAESDEIIAVNEKLDENTLKAQENANEHDMANKKIMLGLLERKLTQDGMLDDAETQWLLEKGVAWGIYSQTVVDETARAINEANALATAINTIPSERTFTMSVMVQGADAVGGLGAGFGEGQWMGYASGTNGWETVPAGYPNDSYMVGLTSGEEFMVVPNGGGAQPAAGGERGGGSGGGNITVVLSMNSVVSMADKEEIKKMQPYVFDMLREAQAQGVIR